MAIIPGVVAAYGFSEPSGPTTADASGNGNVGTLLGGATRITTGKYGNAISFNGTGAAVRIPDSPSWKVSDSPTYTISLWIKVKDAGGDYRVAIGSGSWPADNLHIYKLGGAWVYNLNTSGLGCMGQTANLSYLTTVDDAYHHIALVMNANAGHGDNTAGAFLKRAIGFMRLDGSDIRFLAHSYNEIVDYWKIPRAMIAPNGKLVVFDSEFRGAGGGDVYVVEVPSR